MKEKLTLYLDESVRLYDSEIEYVKLFLEQRLETKIGIIDSIDNESPDLSYGNASGAIAIPFHFDHFTSIENGKITFNSKLQLENIPITTKFSNVDNIQGLVPESIKIGEGYTFQYDLFANLFIHLTRIEEKESTDLDRHERFQLKNSIAYQFGFQNIPISEYLAESLREALVVKFEFSSKRIVKTQILPTHDVDRLRSYHSKWSLFREAAGDIYRRRKKVLNVFIDTFKALFSNEPKKSFSYLVDQSKKRRLKSLFLFLCPSECSKDANYMDDFRKDFLRAVEFLKVNDQEIGLHPGYNTYKDSSLMLSQKRLLEGYVKSPIAYVRQHVLRWDPSTPNIQEEAEIKTDLTLAYTEGVTFRGGTTGAYNAYCLEARKTLNLKLVNTPIMDFSLFMDKYLNISTDEAFEEVRKCALHYKNVGGVLPILFHTVTVMKMTNIYEKTLDIILKEVSDES